MQADATDNTRRAIKVWMRDVMQQKGWTANEWARRAGTSATNVTRFLSPTSGIVPSAATIVKLSRAAGTQPSLGYLVDRIMLAACFVVSLHAHMVTARAMGESDGRRRCLFEDCY